MVIKIFCSCLMLLDFLPFCLIFCPALQKWQWDLFFNLRCKSSGTALLFKAFLKFVMSSDEQRSKNVSYKNISSVDNRFKLRWAIF